MMESIEAIKENINIDLNGCSLAFFSDNGTKISEFKFTEEIIEAIICKRWSFSNPKIEEYYISSVELPALNYYKDSDCRAKISHFVPKEA